MRKEEIKMSDIKQCKEVSNDEKEEKEEKEAG